MATVKIAITLDQEIVARLDQLVEERTPFRVAVAPSRRRFATSSTHEAEPPCPRVCEARPGVRKGAGRGRHGKGLQRMARILRGDVVWAELDPVRGHEQGGTRPVVVISEEIFNSRSGTVIAMAITSQPPRAGFPLTLELAGVRLPKRSWVKIAQVRTLSVERIGKKIGQLSVEDLNRLIEGFNEICGA